MSKRVITGIGFAIIMLVFVIPAFVVPLLTALFFVGLALICSLEYVKALHKKMTDLSIMATLGAVLVAFVGPFFTWLIYRKFRPGWQLLTAKTPALTPSWQSDMIWLSFISLGISLLVVCFYFIFTVLIRVLKKGYPKLGFVLLEQSAVLYIAIPFVCATLFLFAIPNGYRWLLYAIIAPWIVDMACYYTGIYFGTTKILPTLSPNKTKEGCIGGILGSVLFSILYFIFFLKGARPMHNQAWLVLVFGLISGVLVGSFAQLGDWIASAIKRYTGKKDFSKLLPSHGGLLDRFDSVLPSFLLTFVIMIFYYLI